MVMIQSTFILETDAKLDSNIPLALKRFKFLNSKMLFQNSTAAASGNVNMDTGTGQMNCYVANVAEVSVPNAMNFLKGRHGSYSKIASVVEDLSQMADPLLVTVVQNHGE